MKTFIGSPTISGRCKRRKTPGRGWRGADPLFPHSFSTAGQSLRTSACTDSKSCGGALLCSSCRVEPTRVHICRFQTSLYHHGPRQTPSAACPRVRNGGVATLTAGLAEEWFARPHPAPL